MYDYLILKACHLVVMGAWLTGMIFLSILYADHTDVSHGSDADKAFQKMERFVLRLIVNPAMILTLVLGVLLIAQNTAIMKSGWMHMKMTLVLVPVLFHVFLARTRRFFAEGSVEHTPRFFRYMAAIPAISLVTIVFLAVIKPF